MMPLQPQPLPPKYFGILIPGQLPILDFELVGDMFVATLANPASVSQLTFFLNQALPDGVAGVLYYSTPPFENIQFIGAIANNRPSDIFHTGFPLNPNVNEQKEIKLIIKAQILESIKELVLLADTNDLQKVYAKKVAQNLFNFLISCTKEELTDTFGNKYLVVPRNLLEKWLIKFEEKYKWDKNFVMKTTEN